jgi:cobalt-precorrin 5A hydrolase
MKIATVALTKKGMEIAVKAGLALDADIFVKNEYMDKVVLNGRIVLVHPFSADFMSLIGKIFLEYDALIFVMACGIAVRSIAPHLRDKTKDPAVVVVDEQGRFAISLLSGHIGGANRLAGRVAAILGGLPVITTATDINGMLAFDELAKDNGCVIENIQMLKKVSAELVNGGKVSFYCDCGLSGVLPDNVVPYGGDDGRPVVVVSNCAEVPVKGEKVLYIRPQNLVLGIGCKRGKTKEEIQDAVEEFLHRNNKSVHSVRCMASIDLKASEKGILEYCGDQNIPFKTYSAEEIRKVEQGFSQSDFVRKTTGVGNVAESCAALASGNFKRICPKTAYDGITLALAEEEKVFAL